MLTTAKLFALLSEFVVLLLGGLLLFIALTRPVGLPARTMTLVLVAILFLYMAMRAWMRREPPAIRQQTHIRAGSLVLVALLIFAITLLPLHFANLLLGLAGCVLVCRGLLGAVVIVRRS
jgi:hypothetical protein